MAAAVQSAVQDVDGDGRTIPIELQLPDAAGLNVSSSGGTYAFSWTAEGDPTVHELGFWLVGAATRGGS